MSLLDTVEPDMKVAIPILGGHQVEDAYFGPKVESMLSQCRKEARKEALLEAAAHFRKTWRPIHDWDRHVEKELRRMAEGAEDGTD